MIADDVISFVKKDIIVFSVAVLFLIVLVLFIIFRDVKWVIISLLTSGYAVLCMFGVLGFLNIEITAVSSNFASLMFILSISMNIHIIVRYQIISNINKNFSNIAKTMKEMLAPCIYTTLTTIVAFLSLVFSNIRPVIDFGWIMTLSLIITFLSTFIVLPVLISFFPQTTTYTNTNSFFINKLFLLVKNNGGKKRYLSSV